jgi:hypothetical protein
MQKNQRYNSATDEGKYFLILEMRFFHKYVTTWKRLESETMYLWASDALVKNWPLMVSSSQALGQGP